MTRVRVTAPSRLHFGPFSLPGPEGVAAPWPVRCFGGVGLMIEKPGLTITAEPRARWSASGLLADRALGFAKKVTEQPFHISVGGEPREHSGLGAGTQLALAVAKAVAPESQVDELARRVGRGRRSAIGIHGFSQGGLIVEAGKHQPDGVAPLVCRHACPDEWAVLLVIPQGLHGAYGTRESEAFERLQQTPMELRETEALCRLVLLEMLPALVERNLDAFGNALYEFNRRAGEIFRPWQGDVYSHPRVKELVETLRSFGVPGTGQSSWGPTVFAIVEAGRAAEIQERLVRRSDSHREQIIVTRAANSGACVVNDELTESSLER